MIRPININLNAAHPELKLLETVTYTGSPSSVFIRGIPPNYGRWAITAVFVAASFPDGSTTTRAAVQSANGVWVATLPATATSGRTENGFRVIADGIDENGEAVTGYIIAVADFAVASLDVTPAPEPGETSYQMLYFDEVPSTLRKGDVAKIDGVLKFYNGSAWEPFAAPVTLDDAVTRMSANGVKSSGIWSAIWGTATTAFSSLHDWVVDQLAGKVSISGDEMTGPLFNRGEEIGPVAWSSSGPPISGPAHSEFGPNGICYEPAYEDVNSGREYISKFRSDKDGFFALLEDIASDYSDETVYTVGQLAIVDGVLKKCTTAGTGGLAVFSATTLEDVLAALRTAIMGKANASDLLAKLDSTSAAPAFSTSSTYAVGEHVTYNGALYRCTTAVTTAGAWTGSTNWTADMASNYFQYALVTKTIANGAVTLDDRAMNAVAVSSSLASLTVNFPTATSGKVRDFGLRLTVASGITTAPELALPQGVVCENADGAAPEIGADGAATILYFTETASGVFLVKGEVVTAIS